MTATAAGYAPTKTEEGSQLALSQVMHTRHFILYFIDR
jgi:hypothetical protein